MMKIHFFVRFHTWPGQSLSVTGNIAGLGDDSMENAFPLSYLNNDYWHGILEFDQKDIRHIRYNYILTNEDGYKIIEWGDDRYINLSKTSSPEEIHVIDTWNHAGEYENAFYSDPFQNILLREQET